MTYQKWLSVLLAGALCLTPLQSYAFPIIPDVSTPELLENYLKLYIKENYKDPITDAELNDAQLKGMFNSLDPYSNYYTKEEFKSLTENLSGSFVGIGVHIEPFNGYLKVTKPILGSPAERAGIKTGDVIIKVNGESISGMVTEAAVNLIKGEAGSTVKITVVKEGTNKEVTYDIVREVIKVQVVTSKLLADSVGYVSLSEFDTGSASEVIYNIKKLSAQNAKGIVLDLRDNPGGYLTEAIELADFFLPKDVEIMSIDYKTFEDEVIRDEENGYKIPVVVLINQNSASASEIVAAALQKNGRAKVVGTKSYGKGTVQDVIRLPQGDGFKLTVAEYKGPGQMKINGVGVKPDYEVKANNPSEAAAFASVAPMAETTVYKAGMSGLNVYSAQQRLNLLGQSLKLTGKMDTNTVNALKAYQKSNKLTVSGYLDLATKKSLEEKTNQLYNRITSDNQLEKALEVLKAL